MIAAALKTVPAFPLGQPVDGRPRYGMTPEQAAAYRWLVANRSHLHAFLLDFRDVAAGVPMHLSTLHHCVRELVDRGWLYEVRGETQTRYGFVAPVMHFEGRCHG